MTDPDLDLDWLRSFLAVYDTGSFTAAALRVHRAQSRVSAHIAQLEQALGVQLFLRSRHPVALSDAGLELLPYAQSVLQQLESAVAAVSTRGGVIRGRVTIQTFPGAAAFFVAPLIKAFQSEFPETEVELHEGGIGPHDAVARGDVDLGVHIATRQPYPAIVRTERLFWEPLVCLLPEGHPLATAPAVSPSVFSDAKVIMTSPTGGSKQGEHSELLARVGVTPAAEYVVGWPTTATALVHAGLGIGLLPDFAARMLDTEKQVKILRVDHPEFVREVFLVTNQGRKYPPVVRQFIASLREHGREIDIASHSALDLPAGDNGELGGDDAADPIPG